MPQPLGGSRCRTSTFAFLHQQKAGGMTVRRMMESLVAHQKLRPRRSSPNLHFESRYPARFGDCPCDSNPKPKQERVWFYSDQAPFCGACPRMRFATLFRDPVSRMRSAFHFCQTRDGQQDHETCHNGAGSAASICDFGRLCAPPPASATTTTALQPRTTSADPPPTRRAAAAVARSRQHGVCEARAR